MNVLFEEDGAFKCAHILSETEASLQVEMPGGRRVKIKSALVLLRFAEPSGTELLERAQAAAQEIDVDFLWEVCMDGEFDFTELARDYHGRPASPQEAATLLLRLHSAPIYFHRKGRGRFRKAPPDILQAALAGLEKKRSQAELAERMVSDLEQRRLPPEFAPILRQLIYKPDRNRIETKALETACGRLGLSAAQLLLRAGAIADTHAYHFDRFLFEYFPQGTDFPTLDSQTDAADLPRADVRAFSIDDAATTEIDDAFSVDIKPDGSLRVGIHIAAPALGFVPGSPLDAIARCRLSTVYMPGNKITMLPDEVVSRFTLAAGDERPALSLYLDVAPDLSIRAHESKIERVPVVANLRHHDIEPLFNQHTLEQGGPDFEFKSELIALHRLACALEIARGKPSTNGMQKEYAFAVDWSRTSSAGSGWVSITERARGAPLDKLVAELMIVANSTWGAALDDAGIPGLYRAQSGGKVRMTTKAAPHEGLGVACYAWSSSPLRRYVDLVNQWQLIAMLSGQSPHFGPRSEALMAAMRDFELTYAAYAEFQRNMERYWCLRALQQQEAKDLQATVLRESLVRLDTLPLTLRVPSLPVCKPGAPVQLALESIDLLEVEAHARFSQFLDTEQEHLPSLPQACETAGEASEGSNLVPDAG